MLVLANPSLTVLVFTGPVTPTLTAPVSCRSSFARSSTWVLGFAKPSLTTLVSSSATPPLPSVLPDRAPGCSILQSQALPPSFLPVRPHLCPRFCQIEHSGAQFCKTESATASATPPPPSVLPDRAPRCSVLQSQALPPMSLQA